MLCYDPEKRISAQECLEHKWFKDDQQDGPKADDTMMKEAMSELLKFNATQKLQQATMTMMVQNMITKEEIAKL